MDRPDRLTELAEHLPFAVDDFETARETYARWRAEGRAEDLQNAQLWAYCYVVWYTYGKFLRDASAGPGELDRVVERSCRRIFKAFATIRDPERFPQFVSVVCKNVLTSHRLRRRHMAELPDVPAPPAPSEIDALDRPLVRRVVERAVALLPPAIGEVARLRLLERRSYADIAETTGHPLATTRTYFSKALVKLRADPDLRALYLGETDPEWGAGARETDRDGETEVRSRPRRGLSPRPPLP